MINAGAIVTTSLVKAADADERFDRDPARRSPRSPGTSCSSTRGRTAQSSGRAIATERWPIFMRSAGSLESDVDDVLDVYFRQSALLVTSCDLAVMAATLANAGRNPLTGDQVVAEEVAEHTCRGHGDLWDVRLRRRMAAAGGPARPRAESPAVWWQCRRANSASGCSARRSTSGATA